METNRGFSLVELLVAIAIFVLLTVGLILQLSSIGGGERLEVGVSQTVGAIKEARYSAVAVEKYKNTDIYPSYGVYFDLNTPDKIIIYADCDVTVDDLTSFVFSDSSTECNGENGMVKKVTLPDNTEIVSLQTVMGAATSSVQKASVEFLRPLPLVRITGGSSDVIPYGYIRIELAHPNTGRSQFVKVYGSGLVTPTIVNVANESP